MLRIRVVSPPPAPPFEREITGQEALLGRSEECHVVVPDRAVSRRHARLFLDQGSWYVEDVGSRGGTRLNESPVDGRAKVAPGDEVAVGQSVVTLLGGESHSAVARRSPSR